MKLNKFIIPNLINIHRKSFNNLIKKKGTLHSIFKSFFPIKSKNNDIKFKYVSFYYKKNFINYNIYKLKNLTYSCKLFIKLKLILNKKKFLYNFRPIQEVFIGEIPFITNNSTFIINGIERVIVSQLHRSPGVLFSFNKSKKNINKLLYNSLILPYKGAWLDFEFNDEDNIYFKINRNKKLPITVLLKALNYSNKKILNIFYKKIIFKIKKKSLYMKLNFKILKGEKFNFNLKKNNKIYLKKNKSINLKFIKRIKKSKINYFKIPKEFIINKILYDNYYDNNKNIISYSNDFLTKDKLIKIKKSNNKYIKIIYINDLNFNSSYISNTLRIDNTRNKIEALESIHKNIYSNFNFKKQINKNLLKELFFKKDKYNLSKIGRIKINRSLKYKDNNNSLTLLKKDITNVIKKLINIRNNIENIDDIDDLSNRRLKLVGELIENQFKILFSYLIKNIKIKMLDKNFDKFVFQDLLNPNFITLFIKKFFCSHELSQFMDQTNPLSEITHKRKISSLGPGGLIRERANFEVRDVHSSYYGRICPIESPEGTNIGLINSLSIYTKIDKYGFLKTPYYLVKNKKVINKINNLLSFEEEEYVIAQAKNKLNKNNFFLKSHVNCRFKKELKIFKTNKINYIDVSKQQILSIAVSLIPFLEHNDANRALMGANMLRQSIPLIKAEKPIVKTGMERIVASDANLYILCKRGGIVQYLDSKKIIIKVNKNETKNKIIDIDVYNLIKYNRTNQNTCINYTPCIKLFDVLKIGDLIAESNCSDKYNLSLGRNVRVAFMSWKGYNFEDSILISERLLKKEFFTSIHIKEYICLARNTKYGIEKITYDLPNIKYNKISKLNKEGIIKLGSKVNEGDILVGKITPIKNECISPEEELINKIFEKKKSKFKDTSLKVPKGISGTVIEIKVTNNENLKTFSNNILFDNCINIDLEKEYKILKFNFFCEIKKILIKNNIKVNLNKVILPSLKKINIKNKKDNKRINFLIKKLNYLNKIFKNKKIKKILINEKEILPDDVNTLVKIYIAYKSYIQPGDKISGRHGNKGIVSKINSIEDMPYDKNGVPIDIILNPLGIPSRMNVGQILEVHLGMAAEGIKNKINKIINKIDKLRILIKEIFKIKLFRNKKINIDKISDKNLIKLSNKLKKNISFISPAFDSINEKDIKKLLKLSGISKNGQITLYDGCTGEKFDKKITVGYMYILKLNHLVDEKIHARSIGPYSLITQQPLGGKSQFGGQRFGEMEVWALEAYGAAYTLQEMLTIKSDDIKGRNQLYKNIINEKYDTSPNIPESFNLLLKEIKSLGISINLID